MGIWNLRFCFREWAVGNREPGAENLTGEELPVIRPQEVAPLCF